jgi:putative phosphoribosyl transferase
MMFADRHAAGREVAAALEGHVEGEVVVLGLPRGGVPVAAEVARLLDAPLDVIVVRKLGVPFQRELAMGALGEGGVVVRNEDVLRAAHITDAELADVARHEQRELDRRARRFRGHRTPVPLSGRVALVVDDGIATGATARAACAVARAQGARRVVLAAPVCSPATAERLADEVDELAVLETPRWFSAVGQAYEHFEPTEDDDVVRLLERAGRQQPAGRPGHAAPDGRAAADEDAVIMTSSHRLLGHLTVPAAALGLVVFAHGSGSSRHSPRNVYVARVLQDAGLATLLVDLLTPGEEVRRAAVFDVELLAGRLAEVAAWARRRADCEHLPLAYFGASTGAAAALWAAAAEHAEVSAVVSRGGRPDLAGARLDQVRAPTLLIVGGADDVVLDLNRQAQARLTCENRLKVIPHATHLFEEPGALEQVATLARDWLVGHLAHTPQPSP